MRNSIKYSLFIILVSPIFLFSQTLDDAFDINMSGIIAERFRMTIIAENLANNMTLKDEETGLPYQKKYLNLVAGERGVKIESIGRSTEPFGRYFDPAAPQSDENGYFYVPNVHMPHEMITLKHTEALFDANISAFKLTKAMYQTSIDLMK